MDSKQAASQTSARKWRAHCQQHARQFLPIRGTSAMRQRIERWEEHLIEQLQSAELPVSARAVALRSIIELRGCTARDAASFFETDPQVIVLGLSLLELPDRQAMPAASAVSKAFATPTHTKAA